MKAWCYRVMGAIGLPEIIVMGIILLLIVAVVVVVVSLVLRKPKVATGLMVCRSCRKAVSPRAASCPHCGEPHPVTS